MTEKKFYAGIVAALVLFVMPCGADVLQFNCETMISYNGVSYLIPSKIYVDYNQNKNTINRYQVDYIPVSLDTLNPEFDTGNAIVKFGHPESIICDYTQEEKYRKWVDPKSNKDKTQNLELYEFSEVEWAMNALFTYNKLMKSKPQEESVIGDAMQNTYVMYDMLVHLNVQGNSIEIITKKSVEDNRRIAFTLFDRFDLPKTISFNDSNCNILVNMSFEHNMGSADSAKDGLFCCN